MNVIEPGVVECSMVYECCQCGGELEIQLPATEGSGVDAVLKAAQENFSNGFAIEGLF